MRIANGLHIADVSGAGASGATLSYNSTIGSFLGAAPTAPTQPGGTSYDAGDNRISSGVYQVGNLIYLANNVLVNGSDQIQWGILDASTNTMLHTGLVSLPGLDLSYPSISANADGTFVIGFNGSGASTNISAYYVICSTTTNVCSTPVQDFGGLASNYDAGSPNRWGDYSWTTVDANDPSNFWLFQQVPVTNAAWGTTITEISTPSSNVPEPGTLGLVGIGLLGLAVIRRKRTGQSSPSHIPGFR